MTCEAYHNERITHHNLSENIIMARGLDLKDKGGDIFTKLAINQSINGQSAPL